MSRTSICPTRRWSPSRSVVLAASTAPVRAMLRRAVPVVPIDRTAASTARVNAVQATYPVPLGNVVTGHNTSVATGG